ncbi:MAG: tetratricopeptide repeat protein [Syntrophomonas sp.]
MNADISGRHRNRLFFAILVLCLMTITIIIAIAKQQNKAYEDNYSRYQQAIQFISQNNYPAARKLLNGLDQNSRECYQVYIARAICAENLGDMTSAAQFIKKARDTRPALLTDQAFLVLYGEILCRSGEFDRAKLYLLESLKYHPNSEQAKRAHVYLKLIDRTRMGENSR